MFTFIYFVHTAVRYLFTVKNCTNAVFCSTFPKRWFLLNIFVFLIIIITKTELVLPFWGLLIVISVNLFVFVVMNFGQF